MKETPGHSYLSIHRGRLPPAAVASVVSGLVLALIAIAALANPPAADKQYVMGVFPHLPPRQLEKIFSPMASDLGKTLNRDIVLRTNTTFERFAESLDNQVFDIVFVQPFDYVRIADNLGYLPLATRTEELAALLVVKENSPLKDINDFKGRKIALPPSIAAVSYLFRDHLKKNGLDPDKDVMLSHHRSHVSCMQQVLIGEADACVTAAPPLRFFENKMKVKMKIVVKNREIPHAQLAIHPRVPEEERETIRQRIISWSETEEGKELLGHGWLKPFLSTSDADYDVIRRMAK
jgi:phosphonate transport system substrate-binding protein